MADAIDAGGGTRSGMPADATPADGPAPARRGRPRLSDEERATRRVALVSGAMGAIRDRGPDVSIDDIADAVGVSKPVLYDYFGDKVGLADAVAARLAEEITGDVEAVVAGGRPTEAELEAAVHAIVVAMVDLVEHEPAIYGFLVRTIRSDGRGFFDNALVEVVRERGALLVSMVSPGLDDRLVRVLVDGTFGFLFFAIESWQIDGGTGREDLERVLSGVVAEGFRGTAQRWA